MKLSILRAKQELKRVDHLIYVTLKYTRTVDVLRSIISKLIYSYDILFDGILNGLKENGKIEALAVVPALKVRQILENIDNDVTQEVAVFYKSLRKIINLKYKSNQEFRRHVNMEVELDTGSFKVYIDTVEDYYHNTLNYFELIEQNIDLWIEGREASDEEDDDDDEDDFEF